jgi:hypothetical protein
MGDNIALDSDSYPDSTTALLEQLPVDIHCLILSCLDVRFVARVIKRCSRYWKRVGDLKHAKCPHVTLDGTMLRRLRLGYAGRSHLNDDTISKSICSSTESLTIIRPDVVSLHFLRDVPWKEMVNIRKLVFKSTKFRFVAAARPFLGAPMGKYFNRLSGVRDVDLSGCTNVDDGLVQSMLLHLTSLESLNINGCTRVDDELLRAFSPPHNLEFVSNIRCLHMQDTSVSQVTVSRLPVSLTDLDISFCCFLDGSTISFISNRLKSLQHLSLNELCQIPGPCFAGLGNLTSLKTLQISSNDQISDDDLEFLSRLTNLEILEAHTCRNISCEIASWFPDSLIMVKLDSDIGFYESLLHRQFFITNKLEDGQEDVHVWARM